MQISKKKSSSGAQKLLCYYYRPPTKLQEGNVFTGVCLSTGGGRPPPPSGGRSRRKIMDQTGSDIIPSPKKEHGTREEVTSHPWNHTSGRYRSYWNAFFLIINQSINQEKSFTVFTVNICTLTELLI